MIDWNSSDWWYDHLEDSDSVRERRVTPERFIVSQKQLTLFYSVEYTLEARVGTQVIATSTPHHKERTRNELNRWARWVIKAKALELTSLGVCVETSYKEYGGDPQELV